MEEEHKIMIEQKEGRRNQESGIRNEEGGRRKEEGGREGSSIRGGGV